MARRWMVVVVAFLAMAIVVAPRAHALWRAQYVLRRLEERLSAANNSPSRASPLSVVSEDFVISEGDSTVRARLYRPRPSTIGRSRAVVLAHGVHYKGIDENRLVAFATALAEAGLFVLTPQLDDLVDYRITLRSKHQVSAAVLHLAHRADLPIQEKIGLLGISFAGGLSLIAATERGVAQNLAWVMSMGGYHDLPRVLHFFATNHVVSAAGPLDRPANEYGIVVLVYGSLERFVPDSERALVEEAMRAWLHEDRDAARAVAARFTRPEAKRLFAQLESQQLGELRPEVERLIVEKNQELEQLSPHGKLGQIPCPVYLLHGKGDSLIPSTEAEWADLELGRRDHTTLITPVIDHAEVDRAPSLRERLALVRFMAAVL